MAREGRIPSRVFTVGMVCAGMFGVAGCASTGLAPTADLAAVPAPQPAVALGAFLEGPVGAKLAEADRDAALKAEVDALASGDRKTWRGLKGTYGYVVPAPAGASTPDAATGECRGFSHTIYFGGRPQTGHGTGCRGADGEWRITG